MYLLFLPHNLIVVMPSRVGWIISAIKSCYFLICVLQGNLHRYVKINLKLLQYGPL